MSPSLAPLCAVLGYRFQRLDLLEEALTHRSFAARNNERLEFLGDALLNLVVAEYLFQQYPKASEGELSRLRASLVRAETLAELSRRGWRQSVLSASRRDYLIEQVAARGLQGYFTELLGLADIYGVSKVQVGKQWLAQSGIAPAACVMVGDTQHDAEVAAALGTGCVLYTGGHQSRKRLEAVCPHVIDDLAQLPQLLETL